MAGKLNTGDAFPQLTLNLTDGSKLDLPAGVSEDLSAKYAVILFYRGHW
jgi:peroxiredoxin